MVRPQREESMAISEGEHGRNEPRRTHGDAKVLLDVMREVYQAVLDRSESFEEDRIGADLAYLLGAMLKGEFCAWPADRPFVLVLRELFPDSEHVVWNYVELDDET
jgi:hypothetical protein